MTSTKQRLTRSQKYIPCSTAAAPIAASGADISAIASADTGALLFTIAVSRLPTVQTTRKIRTRNTGGVLSSEWNHQSYRPTPHAAATIHTPATTPAKAQRLTYWRLPGITSGRAGTGSGSDRTSTGSGSAATGCTGSAWAGNSPVKLGK